MRRADTPGQQNDFWCPLSIHKLNGKTPLPRQARDKRSKKLNKEHAVFFLQGDYMMKISWCEKLPLFWSFPYVRPEPVLTKMVVFKYKWLKNCRFFAGAHGIADRRCGNALDGHRRRALIRPLVSDCDAECDKLAPDLSPSI